MAINPEDFHNNIREQLAHAGLPGVPEDVREVPLSQDAPVIEPGMTVPATVAEGFSHGGLTTDEKFLAMTHSMEAPENLDLPLSTEPLAEDDHITETDLFTEDTVTEPAHAMTQPETRESRLIMDRPVEPVLLPATTERPTKNGKPRKWIAPTAGAAALLVAAGAYAGLHGNNEGNNADRAANTTPAATATQIPGATEKAPTPTASVDPANIPTTPAETTTIPVTTPEKGSFESYEVSVEDYPTAELAIPAFGDRFTAFISEGVAGEGAFEAPNSIHADDNILKAIYGPYMDNHPEGIHNLRVMREKIAIAHAVSKSYFGDENKITISYSLEVDSGADAPAGFIPVIDHIDTNIPELFPNNHAWDVNTYLSYMQLAKVHSSSGKQVWVIRQSIDR